MSTTVIMAFRANGRFSRLYTLQNDQHSVLMTPANHHNGGYDVMARRSLKLTQRNVDFHVVAVIEVDERQVVCVVDVKRETRCEDGGRLPLAFGANNSENDPR